MNLAWLHKQSTPKNHSETDTERLDRLEGAFRQLLLEWEDTYERIQRLMARINKRARDLTRREETAEDAPRATNDQLNGVDPISAQILARRHRVSPRIDGSAG